MNSNSIEKIAVVDKPVFAIACSVVLGVCLPLIFFPETSAEVTRVIYAWIAKYLGLAYQWTVIGAIIFLAWVAFGRYGHIRLGPEDEKPEFSTFSWIAMIFAAGIGAGLMFWAGIEWGYYYDAPPFGAEPRSLEAVEWAGAYGLFHWGLSAWAVYALPAVAIAYPYYVKKVPYLRLSTSCHALLGHKGENSWEGRLLDLVFMLGIIGGSATSLGLATPMISALISRLVGIEVSFGLDIAVVVTCVVIFGISAYLGLDKGIKRLSNINIVVALLLLLFILVTGPTLFILRVGADSLGVMLDNMMRMLTWTDPIERTGFVEDWTIFYWAWWIAYGPFTGLFVARISKGRTLKEMILSMTLLGSLGCWLFFIVIGNYAMFLELEGTLSVTDYLKNNDAAAGIAAIVATLPFSQLAMAAFTFVCVVFVATTYDSASYIIASAATSELKIGHNPARWHRLFWAGMLGLLPVALLMVGGLKVVQSAVLVASLPVLVVLVLMTVSLYKSLRESDLEQM
ncbi:MAG: BCCT family transporter [Oceanicoccus sp.]